MGAARRTAGDITKLYVIATSLRFDTSPIHPDIGVIRAFDRKIVALLPLLTAIEDRLGVLRGIGALPAKIARVVQDVHDWVQTATPNDPPRADELRQACLAGTPPLGERNSWADLVAANLTEYHAELIDSWQASLDLAAYLGLSPSRQPSAGVRARSARSSARSRCIPIGASRCSRRYPRPWRWASAPSSGSSLRGPRGPMPWLLPRSPAPCSRPSTIRRRLCAP